ncbi:MAG TPA: GAF domain-containing protein [Candidatus Limnocylindrales bacterium]|jgi:GAF domain-containing protein|nr:GAF domain-containing protein [Candidatus Limnocylindrales bacterium]
MSEPPAPDARSALAELARRAAIASRLRSASETQLLQSILDTAVILFRAEAASLALTSRDGRSLEFVVASGSKGQGVVGRTIAMGEGIAGYVSQTGQPIALVTPEQDPRFGRTVAEQTGYVPSSILAVPLLTADRTVGVIEVLESRDGAFTGTDLELASAFARQAAIAVDAFRVEREFPLLVARALESYGLAVDADLGTELAGLDDDHDDDFWNLVDEISALSSVSPRTRAFVLDLLPLVHRHFQESKGLRFGR